MNPNKELLWGLWVAWIQLPKVQAWSVRTDDGLGPRVGPYSEYLFPFLGFRFPYNL